MADKECATFHDVNIALARLEERVSALAESVRSTNNLHDIASEVRSKEIDRRLEFLNGEAARLREIHNHYLPRETYEVNHQNLEGRLRVLETFRGNSEGRQWVSNSIVVFVGAIIAAAISALIKGW